jgi:hypothetical protein
MIRAADFVSGADFEQLSGAGLKRHYELVVFPGHHEYVTTPEYDAVVDYRNLGGHLMWLSANNFFWRVVKHGDVMTRTRRWRDLGRPESALIGVQNCENDEGTHRGAWFVRTGMGTRGCGEHRPRRRRQLRQGHRGPARDPALTADDPDRRDDPEPVRRRPQRRRDVLIDEIRRGGVCGGRVQPRGSDLRGARRAARVEPVDRLCGTAAS